MLIQKQTKVFEIKKYFPNNFFFPLLKAEQIMSRNTLPPSWNYFNCLFSGLLEVRDDNGQEDKVYVMQASLYFSEQDRNNAMMLCKNLRLEGAYQAWTRALGISVTSEDGKDMLKGRIFIGLPH